MNLGVEEAQAKLLMEEMCKRTDRDFPGVQALVPIIDVFLERAKKTQLKAIVVNEEMPDDGRIYFRVTDPEDCKIYSRASWDAKVIGRREFNDIVRGEAVINQGLWLELHVSEAYNDEDGHRKAYVPIFTNDPDPEDRDEILERLGPREYPRKPRWEEMKLVVRPLGLKPPTDMQVPQDYNRWRDPTPASQPPWPYIYKHGLAIACMLRGAEAYVIDSFCRFHWVTGWNHIFLFFDDPEDKGIAHAKELEKFCISKEVEGVGLSVIKMDAEWWEKAKAQSRFFQRRDKSDSFELVCKLYEKHNDVESKQMIVFDMALMEAQEMGIDWFANLDIDECVYTPKVQENSSRRFLGQRERSCQAVRLWNHEAVPEDMEGHDWFRESTLFQVNRYHCHGFKPPREYDQILRRKEGTEFAPVPQEKETEWWNDIMARIHLKRQKAAARLKLELGGRPGKMPNLDKIEKPANVDGELETFFSFTQYEHGKCIVRLDSHHKPPLPLGVHGYVSDNGDRLKETYQANNHDDAVVLHYPNANFDYWREKYQKLGTFQNVKGDLPRVHLASSKVVLQKTRMQQELFYRTFVMQNEHSELPYLAEHGLVIRITGVKETLEFYDQPADAQEALPGQTEWRDAESGLKLGGLNR